MDSTALVHHGVLGMKWGVRRYQNKDGTLTPTGKKHYGDDDKTKEKSPKSTTSRNRSKMSDAELARKIQRLEKETKLKDLEKKNRDDGKAYAEEILKDIGKRVIVTAATGAILYGGKVIIDKGSFSVGDLAEAVFRGGAKKK